METANSDKSGDELETTDSVRMFDLETMNQLKARRKKGKQKKRQHRDNKGSRKDRMSRQDERKGRGAWNRTGRRVRVRREARKYWSKEPEEREEPHVELEGEC